MTEYFDGHSNVPSDGIFDASQYKIAELVPHAAPMILLDAVTHWTPTTLSAELKIHPLSALVTDCGVPAYVGIEYMAQAVSAHGGIRKLIDKCPVQIGFLLGSRRYHSSTENFPLGANIKIHITENIRNEDGLCVFDCKIEGELNDETFFAEASLNVFQPKNAESFLSNKS